MLYVLALLLGVTGGLRAATPLAAVSIGAYLGWMNLGTTWAAFLGTIVAAVILGILAIAELVSDQLPSAPEPQGTPAVRRPYRQRRFLRRRDRPAVGRLDWRPDRRSHRRRAGNAGRLRGAQAAGRGDRRPGPSDCAARRRGGSDRRPAYRPRRGLSRYSGSILAANRQGRILSA